MAIIHSKFMSYISRLFRRSINTSIDAIYHDQLLQISEYCCFEEDSINFATNYSFSDLQIKNAREAYIQGGIIGVIKSYFGDEILLEGIKQQVERKVIILKKGFPHLPATKASTIFKGFMHNIDHEDVLNIYKSYGLTHSLKDLSKKIDFIDINKRVQNLAALTNLDYQSDMVKKVQQRYLAMRRYLVAKKGKKELAIQSSGLHRSLFFYYWSNFKKYGLLGLIDKGKETFRASKIGFENEAKIVIDKIQNPKRVESFYVKQMKTKGITIDRSAISKIFSRWEVSKYKTAFKNNLNRLEIDDKNENKTDVIDAEEVQTEYKKFRRFVDKKYISTIKRMAKSGLYVDAPGLLVLWVYIEKLGILPVLEHMGLTHPRNGRGYSWLDNFLLNVGRIFYGIPSYSKTCENEEPTLSIFSHLSSLPCKDSFLNGLGNITEDHVFELQKWLVKRSKELGLTKGERLAFDFHQIDVDVKFGGLRGFGKGPSSKKKICYNGFRPHIAWDIDTGNLIVGEFRKSSARGTTTVKRFIKDFILSPYKGLFKNVYLDSEYTGKEVWSFILDNQKGMGAKLTACIKQNPFVKKERDKFISENCTSDDFWLYHDDNHVYSAETFKLSWIHGKGADKKELNLYCVVKKNIKTGKLRCFATSSKEHTSKEILQDFSNRWIIENGIKDLIQSYYLDNCPGTNNTHHVNVHFFIVSVCKHLYEMIQTDLGQSIKNYDGTKKTLKSMREKLFKQGSAVIKFRNDTFEIHFLNNYTSKLTNQLAKLYLNAHDISKDGLSLLGGFKIKYVLNPPLGKESRNSMERIPLDAIK